MVQDTQNKTRFPFVYLAVVAALAVAGTPAQALKIGDEAPAISIQEWVQGDPVELNPDSDTVYVVEFWATWCGPCRKSIPVLNSLHEKYGDGALVIIGITDEDKETVGGFMEKMEMNYTIAIDQDSETWEAYAVSTGVDGIPHAFVVKQGRLFWEGSPMDGFDSAVSAILDNNYDLEKAIADQRIKRLAEVWVPQYTLLAADKANAEAADALGNRILEQCGNHAQVLNELAWNIVSDKTLAYRNLDFALQLAEKACALTDTPSSDMLDTHARALYEKGRTEEAIARQKQAIEVCDDESEKTDQLMPFLEEMENPDAHAQRMRLTQDADLYMTFARYGLDVAEADAIGERLLNSAISDAGMLSGIAWYIAIGDDLAYRNLDFALQLAEKRWRSPNEMTPIFWIRMRKCFLKWAVKKKRLLN